LIVRVNIIDGHVIVEINKFDISLLLYLFKNKLSIIIVRISKGNREIENL